MHCTDTGTLRVTSKSLHEYKFTAEGMTRGNYGPLRSDQPYKVRCEYCCVHYLNNKIRHAQTGVQISQKDLHIFDTLGRGASSVV